MNSDLSNEIIIITAARPGVWMREKLRPSGWGRAITETFNSDYREFMTDLRNIDDEIYQWVKDIKAEGKRARRAFKAKKYIDVAILLAKINQKFNDIKTKSDEIKSRRDELLTDIETKDYSEELSKELFEGIGQQKKEAGLKDWWESKKREWAISKLDRNYQAEKKVAVRKLLGILDIVTAKISDFAKDLGKARARGDVHNYINILRQVSAQQNKFQSLLNDTYDKYLRRDVEAVLQKQEEDRQKYVQELAARQEAEQQAQQAQLQEQDVELQGLKEEQQQKDEIGALWNNITKSSFENADDLRVAKESLKELANKYIAQYKDGSLSIDDFQNYLISLKTSILPNFNKWDNKFEAGEEDRQITQDLAGMVDRALMPDSPAPRQPETSSEMKDEDLPPSSMVQNISLRDGDVSVREFGVDSGEEAPPSSMVQNISLRDGDVSAREFGADSGTEAPTSREMPPGAPSSDPSDEAPLTDRSPKSPYSKPPADPVNVDIEMAKSEARKQLFNEFKKVAKTNDPYLLAMVLVKHAGKIEQYDLNTSLKLIAIAEGVLNA